ncbi:MAG: hypothetical protein HFH13_06915 [Dorea sp.]|nr:hypothetical protein [Dorea sp.]
MEKNIQAVHERLDSIEEILKMLLAANILKDLESFELEEEGEERILPKNISTYLDICGMHESDHYNKFNKIVLELVCEEKVSFQDVYTARKWIAEETEGMLPVFCFNKLNMKDKKVLIEEKISFLIKDKELQIFNL